ncbi:MAG: RNA polymerase sigma factor [Bacillota bacterium]|jgi:RNA polymerase sigma-70 factor (ECF subfamily)
MDASKIDFLVDEYGKDLYRFCRRLTFDVFEAEELYQDTFLKAVEAADNIDRDLNPKAWLLTLAVSLWQNKKRKYARRQRIAPTVTITDDMAAVLAAEENTEDTVLKKDLMNSVNVVVAELDDKLRIPVLLYYNSGLSMAEIAAVLNCPEGTVKSRLHKARKTIKERLKVRTEVDKDE